MQIELTKHFLGASEHPLMLVAAGFGRGNRDQFDLGELVLADHAAGVAPGSTRFGTEARRQRGQAHRQLLFLDDGLAHQIGQRHLSGGDQPEALAAQPAVRSGQHLSLDRPELVILELRQLPGTEHHLIAYQKRRIDLGVAVLIGVQIEHELPDRALEPSQAFLQHDKTRA